MLAPMSADQVPPEPPGRGRLPGGPSAGSASAAAAGTTLGSVWDRGRRASVSTPEYEVRQLVLSRSVSRSAARQLLTDSAEHDGWELSRLSLFQDGTRRVTLRRRIIRARPTLDGLVPSA